jgi:hypothetical protein
MKKQKIIDFFGELLVSTITLGFFLIIILGFLS